MQSSADASQPLDNISAVRNAMRSFAAERDWEKYHTPKNLCMALTGEVGELMELMQWKSNEEILAEARANGKFAEDVGDELADVLLYLVRLSDQLGVDLSSSVARKMAKNAQKYPVELAKGNARKYTELANSTESSSAQASSAAKE